MKERAVWLLAFFLAALVPAAGATEEEEDDSAVVAPVGEVFFRWGYNLSGYEAWDPRYPDRDVQAFDVTRLYLGAKARWGEVVSGRIVLDAERDDEGRLTPAARFAFANFRVFEPLQVRAGLLPTAYVPFLDWAYDHRFVQEPAYLLWLYRRATLVPRVGEVEVRREGRAQESDLGLALLGLFPRGYGSYQVGVYNGEGYREPESNAGKAVDLRVTFQPVQTVDALRLLSLSVFFHFEKIDPDREENLLRYSLLLHYRYRIGQDLRVNFGAGLDNQFYFPFRGASDAETISAFLLSAFADFRFYRGLSVFARYDWFDPDTENDEATHGSKDERSLLVVGVGYELDRHVSFALDYQMFGYTEEVRDARGREVTQDPDQLLFAHLRLGF